MITRMLAYVQRRYAVPWIEMTKARTVEVTISHTAQGNQLWVHANGKLIVRIFGIGAITIEDRRTKQDNEPEAT